MDSQTDSTQELNLRDMNSFGSWIVENRDGVVAPSHLDVVYQTSMLELREDELIPENYFEEIEIIGQDGDIRVTSRASFLVNEAREILDKVLKVDGQGDWGSDPMSKSEIVEYLDDVSWKFKDIVLGIVDDKTLDNTQEFEAIVIEGGING